MMSSSALASTWQSDGGEHGNHSLDPQHQSILQASAPSSIESQREKRPIRKDPQCSLQRLLIISKQRLSNFYGLAVRVVGGIISLFIWLLSVPVDLVSRSMFEDTCYLEFVEGRDPNTNRWRIAQWSPKIDWRKIEESELPRGCKDLMAAGCSFKTSATTKRQNSRPIEVPSRSLNYVMRSLGFDIVHSDDVSRIYATRFARSIKATVTLQESIGGRWAFGTDILILEIQVTDKEETATVVQNVRSNMPFTNNARYQAQYVLLK